MKFGDLKCECCGVSGADTPMHRANMIGLEFVDHA